MSKWAEVKSVRIRQAMRQGLEDDREFSHAEVVELVRAALSDGFLTADELNDLAIIARISDTMPVRSLRMIDHLINEAVKAPPGPFNLLGTRKEFAASMICDFMRRMGSPYFPKLDRDQVGVGLLMRVANPSMINQRMAGICGPAAFLHGLAIDAPGVYAKFAIDLFEMGKAKVGRIEVKPGSDCRNYSPGLQMNHADWLTAATLRDSENDVLDFDALDSWGSGTSNSEVARWFSKAGYTDVHADDNLVAGRDSDDIDHLNGLYNKGYRIVLRINSKMLYTKSQGDTTYRGNHFVVLRSPITVNGNNVNLTVFTWGYGEYNIPRGTPLSTGDFLGNTYGYVAAKPF